ncbi:MAG: holin [Oscillospiraceae bacterium]|nr:holin [Oscillospiraceae bacterium]
MKINKIWFKYAAVRAVRTVAQSAISAIGVSAMISDVNWLMVLSTSALAGVLSILTSFSGLPEVEIESKNRNENKGDMEFEQ